MVVRKLERSRDSLQAYYTTSPDIVSYMVSRLSPTSEGTIWEPSAGDGDLVAGVLDVAPQSLIRASEIDPETAARLQERFSSYPNVKVIMEDALDVGEHPLLDNPKPVARIVANPPYGAWQDFKRRNGLKWRFPGLYVKDSYGVFLFHCFQRLAPYGRLVFIVPDTFLWLHRHEVLRKHLLMDATVEELCLFPSKFFPGVDFGYSGLCIITLRKECPLESSEVTILRGFGDPSILSRLASGEDTQQAFEKISISQKSVLTNPSCAFLLPPPNSRKTINGSYESSLGEVASLATGFYSGNDRLWLRRASEKVRGAKNYQPVIPELIPQYLSGEHPPLSGIASNRCFIPILKGGAVSFVKPTTFYVDWSKDAVAEYTRKGKNPARFQNSRFYFRQGLGVPMVASSRLTAALLDHRLFDQGIVGVFPHDERLLKYLLGFLNSRLATEFIRAINPTANNSANYLKRLPLVLPSKAELAEVNDMVDLILHNISAELDSPTKIIEELENVVRTIWRISNA